jgi:hypothetical protein
MSYFILHYTRQSAKINKIKMNIDRLCCIFHEKSVPKYAVGNSRRIFEIGFELLNTLSIDDVLVKLDYVFDNMEKSKVKSQSSKISYFSALKQALQSVPAFNAKVPDGLWDKLKEAQRNESRKRKLANNDNVTESDDDDDVVIARKKQRLVPNNEVPVVEEKPEVVTVQEEKKEERNDIASSSSPTSPFYELSLHGNLPKLYFIRKDNSDILEVKHKCFKSVLDINNEEAVKTYIVKLLETMLKDACQFDIDVKCDLSYGGDKVYHCNLPQATKNIRYVADYIWKEVISPFYKVVTSM